MHRKVKDDSMPQHVSTSPLTKCEMKKRKVPVLKLSRRAAGAVWSGWSGDGCSLPEEGLQQVPQRPGTQQAHPHHGRLCLVSSSLWPSDWSCWPCMNDNSLFYWHAFRTKRILICRGFFEVTHTCLLFHCVLIFSQRQKTHLHWFPFWTLIISTNVFFTFHQVRGESYPHIPIPTLFIPVLVRWSLSRTSQQISCKVSFDSAGPALSAASLQKITFWLKGECFFCWSCSAYVADRSLASNSFFVLFPSLYHWNIHSAHLHSIVEPSMHLLHHPGHPARAVRQPQHSVLHPQVAGQERSDGSQSSAAAVERRGGEAERQPEPPGSDCRSACGSTVCFDQVKSCLVGAREPN